MCKINGNKKEKKSINNGHFNPNILEKLTNGKRRDKNGKANKKKIDREAVYYNNN